MKKNWIRWRLIDWSRSNKDIAKNYGYTSQAIYTYRKKYAPQTIGKFYGTKVKDWTIVDWSKRDIELARELNVTRERVRQVRWKFKKLKNMNSIS